MSLIKQVWLLVLFIIVSAMIASAGVSALSARDYLQTQLQMKNNDNAQILALSLSRLDGDALAMELAISSQFDTGFYKQIDWMDASGKTIFQKQGQTAEPQRVPQWFKNLFPIDPPAGVSQITNGWKSAGTIRVISQYEYAYQELWQSTLTTILWLSLVGLFAGVIALMAVRRIQKPLKATVGQAQALMSRQFKEVDVPHVPELKQLTQAMNAMVRRVRALFEDQLIEIQQLEDRLHRDDLTGLWNRTAFFSRLERLLEHSSERDNGIVLLIRVNDLMALNRVWGRETVDAFLQKLARLLLLVPLKDRMVGRLNAHDFAIVGTVESGDFQEWAQSLLDHCSKLDSTHVAHLVAAATLWKSYKNISELLTHLDTALAQSELSSRHQVRWVDLNAPQSVHSDWGAETWLRHLTTALQPQRMQLTEYSVIDRSGQLIHFECPLSLLLGDEPQPVSARDWLPFACRFDLTQHIDIKAIEVVLGQISKDQSQRSVHILTANLQSSLFLQQFEQLMKSQSQHANKLWIEMPEEALLKQPDMLKLFIQKAHAFGIKVGIEHITGAFLQVPRLWEYGLDFVKIDVSLTRGIAQDTLRQEYLTRLNKTILSLGIMTIAEGVSNADDAQVIWLCQVKGLTGSYVG